jgi:hypothetical protein
MRSKHRSFPKQLGRGKSVTHNLTELTEQADIHIQRANGGAARRMERSVRFFRRFLRVPKILSCLARLLLDIALDFLFRVARDLANSFINLALDLLRRALDLILVHGKPPVRY